VWFVGLEEGLGGADDERRQEAFRYGERLRRRWIYARDVSTILISRKTRFREPRRAMDGQDYARRNGETDWWGKVEPYIRERLGRSEGETFLTELSPIPSRTHADKRRKEWFKKNEPLFEDKLEKRQKNCDPFEGSGGQGRRTVGHLLRERAS
jgi:hypothetical protein